MCQCEMMIKKSFKKANWGHMTINTTYHNDRLLQLTHKLQPYSNKQPVRHQE
jgi:hypothetical protein